MRYFSGALVALVIGWGLCAPSVAQELFPIQAIASVTPPGPAVEAGFTTLAFNADFSTSAYANPSANWLDYNNTDSTKLWHGGIPGIFNVTNTISQKLDTLDGSTVLNIHMPASADCSGADAGTLNCAVGMQTAINSGVGPYSAHFPNMYYETIARVERTSPLDTACSPPGVSDCGPLGVWMWFTSNGDEIDNVELQQDRGGYGNDGIANWGNGSGGAQAWASYITPNNLPPGYSVTGYHKYGVMQTSDGATSAYLCFFVDDILQSCIQPPGGLTASEYTSRHFLVVSAQAAGGGVPVSFNRDLDVKRMTVWSCANWQGQPSNDAAHMCNGSTLATDTNGVTYWH